MHARGGLEADARRGPGPCRGYSTHRRLHWRMHRRSQHTLSAGPCRGAARPCLSARLWTPVGPCLSTLSAPVSRLLPLGLYFRVAHHLGTCYDTCHLKFRRASLIVAAARARIGVSGSVRRDVACHTHSRRACTASLSGWAGDVVARGRRGPRCPHPGRAVTRWSCLSGCVTVGGGRGLLRWRLRELEAAETDMLVRGWRMLIDADRWTWTG
jgi:hypothetical protein